MSSIFRFKKRPEASAYVMENDLSPSDDIPLLAHEATAPPQYTSHEVLVNEVSASVEIKPPAAASAVQVTGRAPDVNITLHNTLNNLSFSGTPFEDVEQFFREWEAMIGTTKLEDKQHLDKLGSSLKSTAKSMYWAKRQKEPSVTMENMKKFLINSFRPERPGMIYRTAAESRVQMPGELVSSYAWDKYSLIQKIDPKPDDKEAIQMVLRGLRSSPLISSLYGEDFSDFMTFYTKLKLKAEGMAFAQSGNDATILLADGEIRSDMQKWTPRVSNTGEKALQKQGRNRQRAWNEQGEPRCFNCNIFGHMAKDCKEEKKGRKDDKKSGNGRREQNK